MPLMLNNPHVDVDAYLAHGGKLTDLITGQGDALLGVRSGNGPEHHER
jgi:hypothetical protein